MLKLNFTIQSEISIPVKVTSGKETEQTEAIQSIVNNLSEDERLLLAKALQKKMLKQKALFYLKKTLK